MKPLPLFDDCLLDGDARTARLGEWVASIGSAVVQRETTEAGIKVLLRATPGLREILQDLVQKERRCCPHLEISVSEDAGGITLEMQDPSASGAKE